MPSTTPISSQRQRGTPTLTHIGELTPGMKNWRIIAKVAFKSEIKPYDGKNGKPDGEYMIVTLLDDQVSTTKLVRRLDLDL